MHFVRDLVGDVISCRNPYVFFLENLPIHCKANVDQSFDNASCHLVDRECVRQLHAKVLQVIKERLLRAYQEGMHCSARTLADTLRIWRVKTYFKAESYGDPQGGPGSIVILNTGKYPGHISVVVHIPATQTSPEIFCSLGLKAVGGRISTSQLVPIQGELAMPDPQMTKALSKKEPVQIVSTSPLTMSIVSKLSSLVDCSGSMDYHESPKLASVKDEPLDSLALAKEIVEHTKNLLGKTQQPRKHVAKRGGVSSRNLTSSSTKKQKPQKQIKSKSSSLSSKGSPKRRQKYSNTKRPVKNSGGKGTPKKHKRSESPKRKKNQNNASLKRKK